MARRRRTDKVHTCRHTWDLLALFDPVARSGGPSLAESPHRCIHVLKPYNKNLTEGKPKRSSLIIEGRNWIECCTIDLAARIIWKNVFGRTSILGGLWFGVVWTGWSSIFSNLIFSNLPLCQESVLQIILFFKSFWRYSASLNQFHPPTTSDDLCLCFCDILILWL